MINKFRKIFLCIKVIAVLIVFSSSCINDDEVYLEYAGKWFTEKSIAVSSGYVKVKYTLELTSNGFKEIFVRPSRTSYSDASQLTIEGAVFSSGKILKLVVHKLSVSNINSAGVVSEPYETHIYGDDDFGFEFVGMGSTISNNNVEYSIEDGKLIFKVDYNRDGIYAENEKSIYSRL